MRAHAINTYKYILSNVAPQAQSEHKMVKSLGGPK